MRAARAALAAALFVGAAFAQSPEKPKTYALVSAIGSEITYVRQVKGTGSNISPYRRYPAQIPDGAIDAAVLRGLDRAIAQEDPDSKRIFLRLQPFAGNGFRIIGGKENENIDSRGGIRPFAWIFFRLGSAVHRGVHISGIDPIHPHACLFQFRRPCLRHAFESEF